tara:strand:+ start:99 stop:752 length:654 start_codon:yes stop_codon:yes gene_type:complete
MKAELTIPNHLSEISLKQYQKFLKIQKNNTDEYFLQCKMIEIFCNLEPKAVKQLKLIDANKVVQIISDMFEQKPNLTKSFVMNDIEYGVIPNLDDISLGEYIDLDTYMGDWDNMEIAMNVLYRPITKKMDEKYLISEYDVDSKDKLTDIPLDVVLGSVFFFYNLGMELSQVMMDYLEDPNKDSLMHRQTFQGSGDGINQSSLYSLNQILQELMISLN